MDTTARRTRNGKIPLHEQRFGEFSFKPFELFVIYTTGPRKRVVLGPERVDGGFVEFGFGLGLPLQELRGIPAERAFQSSRHDELSELPVGLASYLAETALRPEIEVVGKQRSFAGKNPNRPFRAHRVHRVSDRLRFYLESLAVRRRNLDCSGVDTGGLPESALFSPCLGYLGHLHKPLAYAIAHLGGCQVVVIRNNPRNIPARV